MLLPIRNRRVIASVVASLGAACSLLAIYSGPHPQPFLASSSGTAIAAVVVFVALVFFGYRSIRNASGSAWRWGCVLAAVIATAQLVGLSLRSFDAVVDPMFTDGRASRTVLHWLGTAWLLAVGLVSLVEVSDRFARRHTDRVPLSPRTGLLARLGSAPHSTQAIAWLAASALITASRLPYQLVYWPGLVFFDTFRSLSYVRGIAGWDTYEPVGFSLYIAGLQHLAWAFGWSDLAMVAVGTLALTVASSAVMGFMLVRMACWGVPRWAWIAALGWVVLDPVIGYASISLVKDIAFSTAMTLFLTCIGELALGPNRPRRRWPWITLTVAAVLVAVTRNNGVYVVLLGMPLLLIPLRTYRRQLLMSFGVIVLAFGLYAGPIFALLRVAPGPAEETYSVPLQQLARIGREDGSSLSGSERSFYLRIFADMPPAELGRHYVPALADPMKLRARLVWKQHSTREFLLGWARLAARYPATAVTATLANTVGYWDPSAPPYDGVFRWSANDVRRIHLDIPSGRPTTGLAAAIEDSGIIPTRDYVHGVHDDGYQGLPIVGLAMSSGPICWAWCIAGLLVIRRRDRAALAVFVPVAILLLTFLAGPVSGGTRYSLSLFMTLPLALAAATLATTRRRGQPSRVTAADTEHEAPAEEAVPEPRVAGNLPHRGGSAAPAAVDKVSESVRSSRDQPIPPDRPDRDRGDDRGASGRRTQ